LTTSHPDDVPDSRHDDHNELRRDPLTGRWVTIAAGRAARPASFVHPPQPRRGPLGCPFCGGHEHQTPPQVWTDRPADEAPDWPGWTVRVVPNKFAAFGPPPSPERPVNVGPDDELLPAEGVHEVVIHGPDHRVSFTELDQRTRAVVVRAWRARLARWGGEPLGAVTVIGNEGHEAGASLEHAHSQVFATVLRPGLVQAEVDRLGGEACAACDLVAAERKHGDRIVADAAGLLTVCPWASSMPLETLIVPDAHLARFQDGDEAGDHAVADALAEAVARLGAVVGRVPAWNVVLHSAPPGVGDFHWHLHLYPRLTTLGGFELGTGVLINVVDPDQAAERLRAARP
jgi:UDPglucose--hexose-1-phosphate uridylyltransferase